VIKVGVAFHIFTGVLLCGTLWRVASYHAIASSNPVIQHAGVAMNIQY
jgi:hypothetical protein